MSRAPDLSYVSVAAWPRGWGREQILRTIVEATALDPLDAGQVAPHGPPLVIAAMEHALATDAVRVLRERRVPAMAVRRSDLEALRPPLVAKRLVAPDGAPRGLFMVEAWRGEGRGLRAGDLVLLVRGRIAKYTRSTSVEHHGYVDMPGDGLGPIAITSSVTDMRGGRDDALDLYTASGPPVRITGKFDFGSLLGKERGYSDGENMDRVATRLGELAGGAEIDLGFTDFKPPPRMASRLTARSAATGAEAVRRDDTPLFDFYSAWTAIMRRAMRAARGQARTGK